MNSLHIQIPFLITLVAGDIVSSEATSGTVRLLLIRPPSREKILTAKYLAALLYTTGLVIFLGLMCVSLGLTLFGSGDLILHHYGKFDIVFIPEAEIPLRMTLAFSGAIWSMTVVASLAFLFSTLAENSIGPIMGTMAVVIVFLFLEIFPLTLPESQTVSLYNLYEPRYDFSMSLFHGKRSCNRPLFAFSHNVGLFAIASIIYQRKDIKS